MRFSDHPLSLDRVVLPPMIASYYSFPTFRSMKSTSSGSAGTVARTGLFAFALVGFVTVSGAALASEWDQWNDVGIWGEPGTIPEPSPAVWADVPAIQGDPVPEAFLASEPVVEYATDSYSYNPGMPSLSSGDALQVPASWSGEGVGAVSAPPRSPFPTSRPSFPVRCPEGLQWCDAVRSCLTAFECEVQSQCPPPGSPLCSAGDVLYGSTCPPLTVCDQCHFSDTTCSASHRLIVPGCVANASGNPPYEPCACDGGYVAVGNECVPDANSCQDLGIPWCGNGILMEQCPPLANCVLKQCYEASNDVCDTFVKWEVLGCVDGAAGNPPSEPCACFEGYVREGDRCVPA